MDANKIIQQGEVAKFVVTFRRADYNPTTENFYLELYSSYMTKKLTIQKSEFQSLSENVWLFSFDTTGIIGKVDARMVMEYSDSEVPDDTRQEIDMQMLCFVVETPCPRFMKCPACSDDGHDVIYNRTDISNIDATYEVLTDLNARAFLTSDNMNIFVLRS